MKSPRPVVTAAIVWLILLATAPVAASTFTPGEVTPLGGLDSQGFSRTSPLGGPSTQVAVVDSPANGGLAAVPVVE